MTTLAKPAHLSPNAPGLPARRDWLRSYQKTLVLLDGVILLVCLTAGVGLRFPHRRQQYLHGVSYFLIAGVIWLMWWAALALTRSYEARYLGEGPEEAKRVLQASVRMAALLGVACYIGHLALSRGFVAWILPLSTVGLLAGRYVARELLRRRRRTGAASHRVIVVGTEARVSELVKQLTRSPEVGFTVVGACLPERRTSLPIDEVGSLSDVAAMVARTGADTVAVTAWRGITANGLRELAYELEGSRVDLLVAPALLNVAGSRVRIRPMAGLPLLQLQEVELSGAGRLIKGVFDRVIAAAMLVLLAPLLLLCSLAVWTTSRGPVLVTERRLGRAGEFFGQLRFRCHVPSVLEGGAARRESDYEFTSVGRVIERCMLDDLPKLVNVLRGDMSLVGPRPVRPGRREGDVADQRRMLVKPGLTGMAQVSGRVGLEPDEALRLDQQYVDNWSFGLDLLLMLKTVGLLVRGRRLS